MGVSRSMIAVLVAWAAASLAPGTVSEATAKAALGPSSKACEKGRGRNLVLISVPGAVVDCGFADTRGGSAQVVLTDGHGGWFIGGSFAGIGALPETHLAHLHHDGTVDKSWHATLPANKEWADGYPPVIGLARSGSTLYAAGPFGVEAVDAATGAQRWLTMANGRNGVLAVAANGHDVFIGGDFSKVGGQAQRWLAALDSQTGKPLLRWHVSLRGQAPMVLAVAVDGPRLYVGGNGITGIGRVKRPGLAAVEASGGRLTSWLPRTAPGLVQGAGVGDVETIVIADGHVFTAGHDGFGITNARTGRNENTKYAIAGVGYRFASYGATAYLAGNCRNSFTGIQGQPRNNLGSINLSNGRVTSWAPNVATYSCVGSIAATRDEVLVAGGFTKTLG